jgi:hypothetical protein
MTVSDRIIVHKSGAISGVNRHTCIPFAALDQAKLNMIYPKQAKRKEYKCRLTTGTNNEIEVERKIDPNKKNIVLHITTNFGKTFTCRTAEQLGQFIDNYKADKKLKRDEDVNIQIGYGRMTQAEYDQVPECKYFDK